MMLQQPQLPTGEYQEKESDRLKLSPSYGLLPRGGQTAIDRELPARYPFLGSDDEQMVPTKKAEGCKRKPENERGGKRSKRDEVNGFAPKMESPPMSSITSAGSDASEGKYPSAALPEKRDYIHVRARRGQATDSHSLAERVRREKINQRMKVLQDLVPGCSKISGKAGMLDEIINYVQSLQRQVEFLSMKLAAVSPTIHFGNVDALFGKQIASVSGVEGVTTMPPEAADAPTPLVRFVPMHQAAAKAALPDALDPPASSAALFSESWPLLEMNPTAYPWEVDLQVLYGVEQRLEKEGPPLPAASPAAAPLLQPSFQWQFGCKG